jgi:hypothetical protein
VAENDQVNPSGNQDQQVNQDQSLGWRAALPNEFKEHEFVKTFQKPGDFVKSALEIKTERDSLKTKVDGAIFKPGEKATDAEVSAYHKAIGVPEKPTDYEFPKAQGMEHDPKMIEWAQKTFHAAHLPKESAAVISQAWDGFIQGMAKAEVDARKKATDEATATLKKELGADFDKSIELTRRLLSEKATKEELKHLEDTGLGNDPMLIRLIVKLAKATGQDSALGGNPPAGPAPKIGMNYETMKEFQT